MQITYRAVLPVPVEEAFDFVAQPANWPRFFERMESVLVREGWGELDGQATMVNRVLGQRVVSDLVVLEWNRPHSFRYVGRNHGRADTDNRRVFEAVPEGTRLTGTTTIQPQPGIAGWVDRVTLLAARPIFQRAMRKLPIQAGKT